MFQTPNAKLRTESIQLLAANAGAQADPLRWKRIVGLLWGVEVAPAAPQLDLTCNLAFAQAGAAGSVNIVLQHGVPFYCRLEAPKLTWFNCVTNGILTLIVES